MRSWLALLVLLLAGCTGAPPPAEGLPPAAASPVLEVVELAEDVPVSSVRSCLNQPPVPQFCFSGYNPTTLLFTPANATIRAVSLHMGQATLALGQVPLEDPVTWQVWCDAPGRTCARPLAQGVDPLPKDVLLEGLDLPAGAPLELYLEGPEQPIAVDFAASALRRAPVTATLTLEWLPEVAPAVREIAVSVDGHSGPCNLVEPTCGHFPGGSEFAYNEVGMVVAANLTMTWTSTSPLDESLELRLLSRFCTASCPPRVVAVGPSPLRLQAEDLRHEDTYLAVYHQDLGDPLAAGQVVGTRTPVHIEGTLSVVED